MVKENDDIRCNDPGTPSQLLPGARGQGQTWEGPGCWGRKERPPTKINRQNKTFIGSIWLNWKGSRGNVKPTFFFSKNFLNSGGIGLLRWNEQDLAHQTLLYCGVHDALGARRDVPSLESVPSPAPGCWGSCKRWGLEWVGAEMRLESHWDPHPLSGLAHSTLLWHLQIFRAGPRWMTGCLTYLRSAWAAKTCHRDPALGKLWPAQRSQPQWSSLLHLSLFTPTG